MADASTLTLTGHVHIALDTDTLYDDLALALTGAAERAVQDRGVFHVALSGGSTPEPFYVRLVTDPRFRQIPWRDSHIWVVDERRVSPSDERSNIRMIRESLAEHITIRRRNVHAVPIGHGNPPAAYEQELDAAVLSRDGENIPRLDFVLLGMGDDAHTASLFPESPAIDEDERWIVGNEGPTVTPPARITMTFPLINAAREVAVLVAGEQKAATLRRIDQQLQLIGPDPRSMPITGVDPEDGELCWYLDPAAAGRGA